MAAAAMALDRSRTAFCRRGEGGGAHGDHLLGVGRLHRLDGVAGIDRPLEGVGRDDLDDFGDLRDVEQGCDARQDVLADRGGGRDDRVVAAGERDDQRCQRLGQIVGKIVALGEQHLGDAGELGGGVGGSLGALAGDQHMDVAADLGGAVSALAVWSERLRCRGQPEEEWPW